MKNIGEAPLAGLYVLAPYDADGRALSFQQSAVSLTEDSAASLTVRYEADSAARVSAFLLDPETSRPLCGKWSAELSANPASLVYFTPDISPQGLIAVYEALGRKAEGERTGVKISTGEGNSNYLRPELIGDFVRMIHGTIVETNTAVGGRRSSTAMHYQLAEDHGFAAVAPVVILDESGDMELPVSNGRHLTSDRVGERFADYDFHVVLSHFKGHLNAGFGGAIKNMSIGYASSAGKNRIHTAGATDSAWLSFGAAAQDDFLESMAEAAKAVADYCGDNILYINVMNRLSVDCDCDPNPREPSMADIGILASLDPVALDQACVDKVYAAPDGRTLVERMESLHGQRTLDYGEEIGLGRRSYRLVSLTETAEDTSNSGGQDGKVQGMPRVQAGEVAAQKSEYVDRNGDTAVIPGGFAVSKREDEQTVQNGLVVVGPDGGEFVWIPTALTALERRDFGSYFSGGGSLSGYWDDTSLETYQSMLQSVGQYGGFYSKRH